MNNFQSYDGDTTKFHKFNESKYFDFINDILNSDYENVVFNGFYQSEEYFNTEEIRSLYKKILNIDTSKTSDYVGL